MGVIGPREIAAGVEPVYRNEKVATLTGGLAHDVSILLGVGRHLGSQPRAKTSITIMRAPQRGHGQGSTRGVSGVISGGFCGSTAKIRKRLLFARCLWLQRFIHRPQQDQLPAARWEVKRRVSSAHSRRGPAGAVRGRRPYRPNVLYLLAKFRRALRLLH
jgi:hypothetical protein